MKTTTFVAMAFIGMLSIFSTTAQNNVGIGTATPDPSAILELESASQGFLPPRMTEAERNLIVTPATGLVVWCSDCCFDCSPQGELQVFDGVKWTNMMRGLAQLGPDPSTNGSAIVSAWNCNPFSNSLNGTYFLGFAISGTATKGLYANVTKVGTYNISVTLNGITFSGSGTFNSITPNAFVLLTATGTPSIVGTNNFVLNTTPSCNFDVEVYDNCGAFVAPGVRKEFMCHNLGANTTLNPFTPDWDINGAYWQWGAIGPLDHRQTTNENNFASRPTDGTTGGANSGVVTNNPIPVIWSQSYANNDAWDAAKTLNDPCPSGYRVPTNTEWQAVASPSNNTSTSVGTWTGSPTNYSSGRLVGSTLYLPAGGWRSNSNGALQSRGQQGYYWSSTSVNAQFPTAPTNQYAYYLLVYQSGVVGNSQNFKTYGMSVRCIKE